MKIRLIEPTTLDTVIRQTRRDIKSYWYARLSLSTVAALTPPDFDVAITDENVERIDLEEDVSLVGISAMTHRTLALA